LEHGHGLVIQQFAAVQGSTLAYGETLRLRLNASFNASAKRR
jgi:hypothetical protein